MKINDVFAKHDKPFYWVTIVPGLSSGQEVYDSLERAEAVFYDYENNTNILDGTTKYLMCKDPDGSMYHIRKAIVIRTPEQRSPELIVYESKIERSAEDIACDMRYMEEYERKTAIERSKVGPYEKTYYFNINGERYPGLYADHHNTYELFIPSMRQQFKNVCTPYEPRPTIFELAVQQYNK